MANDELIRVLMEQSAREEALRKPITDRVMSVMRDLVCSPVDRMTLVSASDDPVVLAEDILNDAIYLGHLRNELRDLWPAEKLARQILRQEQRIVISFLLGGGDLRVEDGKTLVAELAGWRSEDEMQPELSAWVGIVTGWAAAMPSPSPVTEVSPAP